MTGKVFGRASAALFSGALSAALIACGAGDAEQVTVPASAVTPATASAKKADPSRGAAVALTTPTTPPKKYETGVERRLYSDRIEASSFLWTDWNRFQENYHPNYLMDGDPKTAWTEGADTSGKDEWVKIQVSELEGATTIRLRLQNGYQKSDSLFAKNARVKTLQVTALPSGEIFTAELKDEMGWQELSFTQKAGPLEALELKALAVYEGSKYTDLCISDVELYVTALTVENPAFEKSKLERLLAWKDERVAAAKAFQSEGSRGLPIAAGYRVITNAQKGGEPKSGDGEFGFLEGMLALVPPAAPASKDAVERARQALTAGRDTWIAQEVLARAPLALPAVDGLDKPTSEDLAYDSREGVFLVPFSKLQGVLLASAGLTVSDIKGTISDDCRKKGEVRFWRAPKQERTGPDVRELIMQSCVVMEERDGEYLYMVTQVLEFDEKGRLVLVAGPHDVQWFEWREGENGSVLTGGLHFYGYDGRIDKLVEAGKS
jgi:hypothetical protein